MKTKFITLVAAAALVGCTTAEAAPKKQKDRDEETIGLGVGGVIGAIAGGPIGFLIGAAGGAWLGDKFDNERNSKNEYQARSERAEALASSLEAVVAEGEGEIEALRLVVRDQEDTYRGALSDAFDVEVYFHTGESTLDQPVAERVERLGEILKGFDDFAIVLEGHADPRGDEGFNEALSAKRAAAVREALVRSGLPGETITTRAVGERDSQATDGDLDAMALERRVNVSIVYPPPRENRVASQ
jgi:outer membrane protein OmpA-like peptidoglycan-associated protein